MKYTTFLFLITKRLMSLALQNILNSNKSSLIGIQGIGFVVHCCMLFL